MRTITTFGLLLALLLLPVEHVRGDDQPAADSEAAKKLQRLREANNDPVAALAEAERQRIEKEEQARRRDIAAVTPQLELVATIIIVQAENVDKETALEMDITWDVTPGAEKTFVREEKHFVDLPIEKKYLFRAVNRRFDYRFQEVCDVRRTGDLSYPLEAVVRFEVTTKTRTAEHGGIAPRKIPDSDRLATQKDLSTMPPPTKLAFAMEEYEVEKEIVRKSAGRSLPLTRPILGGFDTSNLPEPVQPAVEELRRKCLAAKAVETTGGIDVAFRYSADNGKWKWWSSKDAEDEEGRDPNRYRWGDFDLSY